ncbi:outer membrane lipoprotein carrier protein LolA [Parapedobacter koreensis]|uniref:Outer membrane lipoprotein carrier protein n=1 Tax=Parapedobacter koreensis TaxID=332977 RepID=A0A1H7S8E4_9SPHI|nr:outer membrane lipoprotein carrier protein LolA [Parapedobacter koreensis]SEL68882.1 outer membrane lipoprotein carrier protein [Parapedobacter koreensis]
MHKYVIATIALLMTFSAGFAQRKALTPAEVAALKAKVAANTKSLQSLESDFTQSKQLSYMDDAINASGKLYFKAPRKIRWEYLQPTGYAVVFDNQTMHVDEGGGKQRHLDMASNKRLKGLSDLLVGTVQGGDLFDDSRFAITYYREGIGYVATLIPKEKALQRYIKQVELTLNGNNFLLTRVKITDPTQDYTLIDFENQRKNAAIPEDKFMIK